MYGMKANFNLQTILFVFLVGVAFLFGSTSCSDSDSDHLSYGTVQGTVTSEEGLPLADVQVLVSGMSETTQTGVDGTYVIENVSIESHSITFSKEGRETISTTVVGGSFKNGNVATSDVVMLDASSVIKGLVLNAKDGEKPFEGVTVSISSTQQVKTGKDGRFEFKNVKTADYTLTFTVDGFSTINRKLAGSDFIDGVAELPVVQMGRVELLRGLTADDLEKADKWYYNEYRGGRNHDAYPHWDWSTNYMGALDFIGGWEEQNEGSTLQIRNSSGDQKNPGNMDIFDSYVYGSKLITNDNKIMSLRVRTHDASENSPAHFGVQVVDLSAQEPQAVRIGETRTLGSPDYTDFAFDLSDYVGKEVIIAIGIYRKDTGNYWKQLVLRAIRFASVEVKDWSWLPGQEVVDGWKLPLEAVRSTMPQLKKSFTGVSSVGGNRDNYIDAYRSWRNIPHIATEWTLVPLSKDPELFPSEGYLLKTRKDAPENLDVPEAYFYAKFSIAAGSNKFTFRTRNFGGKDTYFKMTTIQNDGTVKHMSPVSNTAQSAAAAESGCWKFVHDAGGAGSPNAYASFVYDLSEFNGKDVVIALGVYNGVANSGENKLVFYKIDLE